MTHWRLLVCLLLLGLIGAPVVLPFLELLGQPQAWHVYTEGPRLLSLARNTLGLIAGTLLLALPAGILGAVLLYRTDLPCRRSLQFVTILTLFVPLPLFTSAWQAALGTEGWLPLAFWSRPVAGDPDLESTGLSWKPWGHGLQSAMWIHAVAVLPWVIVLVGQGLRWVERELEEDALTVAGPWRVLWSVTLPRCRAAILAAGLWIALAALTEITVSDMMQVRTYAEEVYTELVVEQHGLAGAVAVSLPAVILTAGLVIWVTRRWERTLPAMETLLAPVRLYPLGAARWPCLVGVLLVAGALLGVPLLSLVWKAGLGGSPAAWSGAVAVSHFRSVLLLRGGMVVQSIVLAGLAGAVTATLGVLLCWLALGSSWFRAGTLCLMALVWATPGPILGLGLKETIHALLAGASAQQPGIPEPVAWVFSPAYWQQQLAVALYYGPSPLPAVWAHLLRFFPCAVALLWPVLRLFPPELREAARVDGARPLQEFRHVVLPLSLASGLSAALAVSVLALGELGASKLVETPGSRTFAHEVFDQMHYGVTNDLAALCLVLLAMIVGAAACYGAVQRIYRG
jgi:iron(III) transport system permease protein